ncbi:hypothetical protein [Natronolimnobius baerhuensis]|nr:hypothetical protein [Natronolimnobius baerhuensis]
MLEASHDAPDLNHANASLTLGVLSFKSGQNAYLRLANCLAEKYAASRI